MTESENKCLWFGIKPQPKKKQPDANNPFKGDGVLETLDNLCRDFSYKQNKPQQNNDSRRKGKGKGTH